MLKNLGSACFDIASRVRLMLIVITMYGAASNHLSHHRLSNWIEAEQEMVMDLTQFHRYGVQRFGHCHRVYAGDLCSLCQGDMPNHWDFTPARVPRSREEDNDERVEDPLMPSSNSSGDGEGDSRGEPRVLFEGVTTSDLW